MYFIAFDGESYHWWLTDGSTATKVQGTPSDWFISRNHESIGSLDSKLYFSVATQDQGWVAWVAEGDTAYFLGDLYPEYEYTSRRHWSPEGFNETLFFLSHNYDLWAVRDDSFEKTNALNIDIFDWEWGALMGQAQGRLVASACEEDPNEDYGGARGRCEILVGDGYTFESVGSFINHDDGAWCVTETEGRAFFLADAAVEGSVMMELGEKEFWRVSPPGVALASGGCPVAAGGRVYSGLWSFDLRATDVEDGSEHNERFEVTTVYPNPARGAVNLKYTTDRTQTVVLEVVDMLGRVVHAVEEGAKPAGSHETQISTDGLVSGVYVLRLRGGGVEAQRRFVVVR